MFQCQSGAAAVAGGALGAPESCDGTGIEKYVVSYLLDSLFIVSSDWSL